MKCLGCRGMSWIQGSNWLLLQDFRCNDGIKKYGEPKKGRGRPQIHHVGRRTLLLEFLMLNLCCKFIGMLPGWWFGTAIFWHFPRNIGFL